MQLNEITYQGQPPIDSYGPGFFRVAEKLHQGAVLIDGDGLNHWTGLDDAAPLLVLRGAVDVVLIGTGQEIGPLPQDLESALEEQQIPFEIMATPSACRTYNVLLAEGRRVAVALLPV